MPELGYLSTYGDKNLEVPLKYFHDLSEWSKVNFLYTPKIAMQVKQFLHQSHDKKRFKRLLNVLEQEAGHSLLAVVEESKIALTSQSNYMAPCHFLEDNFSIEVSRKQFEESIQHEVDKITNAAIECLSQARITNNDIDLVILTGGSTEVPLIQTMFKNLFPKASLADENKLSSVGLGLAYDSVNKFG